MKTCSAQATNLFINSSLRAYILLLPVHQARAESQMDRHVSWSLEMYSWALESAMGSKLITGFPDLVMNTTVCLLQSMIFLMVRRHIIIEKKAMHFLTLAVL